MKLEADTATPIEAGNLKPIAEPSSALDDGNASLKEAISDLQEKNARLEGTLSILASHSSLQTSELFSSDDEVDLRELWNAIWQGKWIIFVITSVFAIASVFYALNLPNEYESTAILAPASNSSSSQMSKLGGQLGGLASLAGISLGGGGGEDKIVIAMDSRVPSSR